MIIINKISSTCQGAKQSQDNLMRQARYYTQGSPKYNEYYDMAKSVNISSWEIAREMRETDM